MSARPPPSVPSPYTSPYRMRPGPGAGCAQEERRFWVQGQGPEMRFSEIRLLIIMSTVGGSCDRFHPVVEAVTVTNLGVTVTNRKL